MKGKQIEIKSDAQAEMYDAYKRDANRCKSTCESKSSMQAIST